MSDNAFLYYRGIRVGGGSLTIFEYPPAYDFVTQQQLVIRPHADDDILASHSLPLAREGIYIARVPTLFFIRVGVVRVGVLL